MKKTITFFKTSIGSTSFLHAFDSKRGLSALRLFSFIVAFLGFTANSAWGQIATWNMAQTGSGTNGSWTGQTNSPTSVTANATVTGLVRGSGLGTSGNPAQYSYGGSGADQTAQGNAITNGDYFTMTLKANTGYTMSITGIPAWYTRKSGTGTMSVMTQYSFDGSTFTDIGSISITSTAGGGSSTPLTFTTAQQTALANLPSTITVTLRFVVISSTNANVYLITGSSSANTSRFQIGGSVTSATPVITPPSHISLSGFTTIAGTASASQTFTIGGSNLTEDLVITAPTDYEVRENSTGTFGSSVSFTPSTGTVGTKTIEVRIAASALVGTPAGNVVCSSTGATSQNVAVAGTVNSASSPVITIDGVINAFANTVMNTTSGEQSYTVLGANLTDNVVITPPAGFEISKISGSDFVTSSGLLTFTPAEVLTARNVFVRFAPTAVQAYSGNITHTSTGATQVDKVVSGTGVNAEPTNQPTGLTATANSSSQITVTWTDASGAQMPAGYIVKAAIDPSSPSAPADGTAETAGTLVKIVAQGTQQAVFTGLSASTTYHFSIWPYTNSGSSINYKTDGTIATASATTETPLGVPVATAATDVTPTGFTANWGAAAAATGYDVSVYTKSRTTASDLFISEYGEGSSSNKYIEIFNGTGKSVNLSEYVLKQSYNGAGWPTDTNSPYYLPLTGTLESNDVFVVSASDASSTILSQSDMKIIQSTTSQGGKITSFTGNDALGLFKNDVLIDVFGDPGSSSTVSVAGFSTYGQDHTIVRKSTVTSGNTDWANSSGTNKTDSEWIGYSQDTWTNIGSHSMVSGLTTTPISGLPFTVTETSKAVSGLNPATTYYYTVVAKNALETSSASNEISVTTDNHLSVSGDVNASTLPDCPTCDVTVSDGAHLTVDAAKTFNAVTVQPTAKLTVSDGVTLTAPVTIKSSSAGTATAIGAVTGSSSVEQYLPDDDRQWWYLSSPVTGATSALFGSDKVGQYNEATTTYSSPFAPDTELEAGKGYVVKLSATTGGTYTFEGTLNNGDYTLSPTRTGVTAGKRGFNLVGNPYPSYLDWDAAYADATSNVRNAIWYRTYSGGQMTFHTYADADGVPEITTGMIPPAQAFWIRVNADGSNGSITFKNTHREHAGVTANPLKAPKANDRPRVRLQISNGVNADEALIVAKSYASNGIDSYDIEKMSNDNVDVPEIYTLLNNQDMVINSFSSFVAGQEIALGMRPGKAGDFTINATQFENIPSDIKVILKDKFTGAETELSENASYSFNADGTEANQRFSLLFRAPGSVTGIDNAGNNTLLVYVQQSEIVVNSEELKGSNITVYTATGQSVLKTVATANCEVLNGNFTPGVYFVKVNNTVKKVSVK